MIGRRWFIAAAVLMLGGCASTTLRDAWSDPDFRGGPFRQVLVLGVSSDIVERRIFEDILAARIRSTGAQAMQGYRFLPDSARADEPTLDRAVRESGADALVMSRIRSIDRRTSVSTVMVPSPMYRGGLGWYGWYSGWYPVADVRRYDIAVVETSVFDTATRRLVWSGVTETFQPTSIADDAPGLADVIARALSARALLPAGG